MCLVLIARLTGTAVGQDEVVPEIQPLRWFANVGYSEYIAAPVSVLRQEGPSPAFVPQWRRGRGIDLAIGRRLGAKNKLMLRGIWDRMPLGYTLDLLPEDHPDLGLSYPVQDLNITRWFRRVSVGLSYQHEWSVLRRSKIRLGGGVLFNTSMKDFPYDSGVAAIDDTTVYWIMGLDARVFPSRSSWRFRGELQYALMVNDRHSLVFGYYFDRPFQNAVVDGGAIILGNSAYRTTVLFEQTGILQGLTIGYEYSWGRPRNSKFSYGSQGRSNGSP